jgi:hypothetical protein
MSEIRTAIAERPQWFDQVTKRDHYPSLASYLEHSSTERETHRL